VGYRLVGSGARSLLSALFSDTARDAEIFGHPVHDPVTKRESWPRTDPRAAAAAAANEANIAQDIAHQVGVLVPDVRGGDLVYERVGDGGLGQTR